MNGFVVLFRGHMDDVPVGLYSTREDATASAEELRNEFNRMNPDKRETIRYPRSVSSATKIIQTDMSTASAIGIAEFISGKLVGYTILDLDV